VEFHIYIIIIGVNVCIGLYLFAEKYANPEEYAAFYVMLIFFIIFATYDISFGLYKVIASKYKKQWVMPIEKKAVEMEHLQADSEEEDDDERTVQLTKKSPSPVSL